MALATTKLVVAGAAVVMLTVGSQGRDESMRLDASGAFYYPAFAGDADAVIAKTVDGPLRSGTYLRYLAARLGTEAVEDLAFEIVLARECERRRLARSAPLLARGMAAQRLEASGRWRDDTDGSLRLKYAAEALRQLRIDALVQADRTVDEEELRSLFERRYGVGGVLRRVRHVLVSYEATRRRLEASGAERSSTAVSTAARERADALRGRLSEGTTFTELLSESDDRVTRRMLRDPNRTDRAGFVSSYDQHRYGAAFARALQELRPGQTSAPIATSQGYHLVELVSEEVTAFAEVEAVLRRQLRGGPATPVEAAALRRALLEKHGFERAR